MYKELKDKQEIAILNATQLMAHYSPIDPANNNPSTTVHILVQELNKFIETEP